MLCRSRRRCRSGSRRCGPDASRRARCPATTATSSPSAAWWRCPPIRTRTAARCPVSDRVRGSAVIQAGAGSGKTHKLVSLCVELLGREDPLPPGKLWAVTFTEKAAAELKGRIRARVDDLAARDPAWRRIRRDLGLAQIGTIHALCGQILRRHAATAGVDPGFAVLDEEQARRLLRDACETTALRALEGALGAPLRDAARRLCAEMGLRTQGKFGIGLAEELAALLQKLGETGASALLLVGDPRAAVDEDARAPRHLDAPI